MIEPEQYKVTPTPHIPNSIFPVLIYRNAFTTTTEPVNQEAIQNHLEVNHWIYEQSWKADMQPHFHSTTHECYAIYQGRSTLCFGRGPLDEADQGADVIVSVGDVIVVPAGVSHCSLDSEGDFWYGAFYPEGSPKWDVHDCRKSGVDLTSLVKNASDVPVPLYDPVNGSHGSLVKIWSHAWNSKV